MPTFEGLTGPINFDSNGNRVNYTIDIHRVALNMAIAKVKKNWLKNYFFQIFNLCFRLVVFQVMVVLKCLKRQYFESGMVSLR